MRLSAAKENLVLTFFGCGCFFVWFPNSYLPLCLHSLYLWLSSLLPFFKTAMDLSRSRDLALRGSRELYYGSPATTRSTPVINRRRPVLLMMQRHHHNDRNQVGSSPMVNSESTRYIVFSHSRNGWLQPNFLVLCFPTSFMTSPTISRWLGTFNLTLMNLNYVTPI